MQNLDGISWYNLYCIIHVILYYTYYTILYILYCTIFSPSTLMFYNDEDNKLIKVGKSAMIFFFNSYVPND